MLIDFFLHLRERRLPATVTEYLTLIEGLRAGVCSHSIDDFYAFARLCLVKDEAHFDRFDVAFAEYFHNTRNAFRNEITRFDVREHALPLDRVVVITTGASASASELVINALRPFIPVVTVGGATYGKPVGQYGFTMCDKVVYPVAFSLRNALGQGDFFGGIAADCPALDDPAHQLGDPEEASLAEALTVVRTGACSPVPEETAAGTLERTRRARVADELPRPRGFDLLVGAH